MAIAHIFRYQTQRKYGTRLGSNSGILDLQSDSLLIAGGAGNICISCKPQRFRDVLKLSQ